MFQSPHHPRSPKQRSIWPLLQIKAFEGDTGTNEKAVHQMALTELAFVHPSGGEHDGGRSIFAPV